MLLILPLFGFSNLHLRYSIIKCKVSHLSFHLLGSSIPLMVDHFQLTFLLASDSSSQFHFSSHSKLIHDTSPLYPHTKIPVSQIRVLQPFPSRPPPAHQSQFEM